VQILLGLFGGEIQRGWIFRKNGYGVPPTRISGLRNENANGHRAR